MPSSLSPLRSDGSVRPGTMRYSSNTVYWGILPQDSVYIALHWCISVERCGGGGGRQDIRRCSKQHTLTVLAEFQLSAEPPYCRNLYHYFVTREDIHSCIFHLWWYSNDWIWQFQIHLQVVCHLCLHRHELENYTLLLYGDISIDSYSVEVMKHWNKAMKFKLLIA